jgi:hydrogenase/urease accessory protein HupE
VRDDSRHVSYLPLLVFVGGMTTVSVVRVMMIMVTMMMMMIIIIIILIIIIIARRSRVRDPMREIIFFFSISLIHPAALGPEIYSASNRNEYQKQKNNVSAE